MIIVRALLFSEKKSEKSRAFATRFFCKKQKRAQTNRLIPNADSNTKENPDFIIRSGFSNRK